MVDWPLTTGVFPVAVTVLGLFALLGLLVGWGRGWWLRKVPIAVGAGVVLASIGTLVVDRWWHPFPDPLPRVVVFSLGFVIAAIGLAVARPGSWRIRCGAAVAALVVLLAGAAQINQYF